MFEYMTLRMWLYGIILPFIFSFIVVTLIHPAVVKLALAKNLVDVPDYRKLQRTPVPVMGGMAVFFGMMISIGLTSVVFNSYALFTCAVAMTVMVYIGMYDDLMGMKPVTKLIIELLVIAFVVKIDLTNINDLHGLFGIGKLPVYLSLPLCSVACLGIINAINMIDGVDGLSSGLLFFACFAFGFMFCASFDGTMAVMASVAAGALVPFFFHNVFGTKSKMYIGDSGTLMLGMLMAIFCMRIIDNTSRVAYQHPNLGVIAFCLSVLSVPVFDTLRVMTVRILKGESPFHADRSHLHHLFIDVGFSAIGTTIMVITLNALNLVCLIVTIILGGGITSQFIVVVVVGLMNTCGVFYIVRRMNHDRWPHRLLVKVAHMTHVETSKSFLFIRNVIDNM